LTAPAPDRQSAPLTIIATMRAKPGQEARARELLLSLLAPTRAEAGCINYDLHECTATPGQFMFHENWTTEAALAAHLKTPHIAELLRLAPEILDAPPELTYWKPLR
jgi:quinol monooxygenase YgiN